MKKTVVATCLATCQYKWDDVVGWNLNQKKKKKEICLPQMTQIFNLLKIAVSSCRREEVELIWELSLNSFQIAVISNTFWLIFKN